MTDAGAQVQPRRIGATDVRARIAAFLVVVATVLVLVAIGIAPFFTPIWIFPGQDRADAEGWTGWPAETVRSVTASVLADLLVGPPDFAQVVNGRAVFDEAEASHLRDVRGVVLAFGAVAVVAAAVLVIARLRIAPTAFWSAVGTGAKVTGVGVVALGIFAIFAFDTAFELFHRLFFAAGTYSFDPATSRLVQLFPEAFWYDTAIAIGVALVALSVVVSLLARWRVRVARGASDAAAGLVGS